jgi:hypothetical protein
MKAAGANPSRHCVAIADLDQTAANTPGAAQSGTRIPSHGCVPDCSSIQRWAGRLPGICKSWTGDTGIGGVPHVVLGLIHGHYGQRPSPKLDPDTRRNGGCALSLAACPRPESLELLPVKFRAVRYQTTRLRQRLSPSHQHGTIVKESSRRIINW